MLLNAISPADGYLTSAISAFNGLLALDESPRLDPIDKIRNSTILGALALECALKHYLAKSGILERDIKNYRHDLVKLWRASHDAGLKVASQPPDWCEWLTRVTNGPLFFIRYGYGANGAIVLPSEVLVAFIDDLIRFIYPDLPPIPPKVDGRPRLTLPSNVVWRSATA